MSSDPESPRFQALSYISHSRFHRLFKHGDLTITYADIGKPSTTTILFMPGMFASRYLSVLLHAIAESLNVRVLVVDRPGMGASSPVPLESRVSTWIALVPRLLSHLNIRHVALASHSAGMIYLLNTLHHCRDLLHPEKPYVAFLAPWVNPAHTRITSMQLAQFLPTFAFGIWNQIPRFLLLAATPALESSGAAMNRVSAVSGSSLRVGTDESSSAQERTRRRVESVHGLSRPVQRELEELVFRFMFEESTVGANEEARQCLCKGPKGSWGVCGDYGGFVRGLVEGERGRVFSEGGAVGEGRLVVRGFFAESDSMIGEKGRAYVERCWKGQEDAAANSHGFDDVLDFEAVVVPGSDHNSIMQETELFERIFREAGVAVDSN